MLRILCAACACPLAPTLVPSHSSSCRPPLTPALCLSPRFLLGGFGALRGFACVRFGRFKPFWPLAPVYPAPPAIFLAALRRFRGPALFHGPRTSSRLGAPFWPSGLTIRRSRPPTAAAELRALANQKEIICSASFSLPCSLLALGRAMKNINLNAQHSNFKKLIFQVVLPGETEALI